MLHYSDGDGRCCDRTAFIVKIFAGMGIHMTKNIMDRVRSTPRPDWPVADKEQWVRR